MKKISYLTAAALCLMVVTLMSCKNPIVDNQVDPENGYEDPIITWDGEKPVEGWELNNGGTRTRLPSSVEATAATNKWGVWLNNHTFGRSLDFSTEGSMAYAPNTAANINGDFTVSLWLMAPPREDHDRMIFMLGPAGGPNHAIFLESQNNFTLTYRAAGVTGTENSGVSMADGKWRHIVISREGDILTYYVNGDTVKSTIVSGFSDCSSGDVYIGADSNGNLGFDGTIGEVRIYHKALLPAEVTTKTLDSRDNEPGQPRLDLRKGLNMDRRQYEQPEPLSWERQTVLEQDIYTIKMMGFDHVKLLLTPNHLIDNNTGRFRSENMFYIQRVVNYVINNNYRAVICLHPEYGPTREFKRYYLGNLDNFEILVNWYGEFAEWVGNNWSPDVVALQLMTEPAYNDETVRDWTWMSDRMWGAVRNALPDHTLITSSDRHGNLERLKLMSPASDSNLIYSFTTYEPYTIGWYFHPIGQGTRTDWSYVRDIPYPVESGVNYSQAIEHAVAMIPDEEGKARVRTALGRYIAGTHDGVRTDFPNHYYPNLYNAQWHRLRAQSLDDWRQKYGGNIHIICSEFGCMDRLTPMHLWNTTEPGSGIPDADRIQFVHDTRSAFEEFDIRWSYWSYNEAYTVFLPEDRINSMYASPMFLAAVDMIDWDMLETGLDVTPLISRPTQPIARRFIFDGSAGGWGGITPGMSTASTPAPPSGGSFISMSGSSGAIGFVNFDIRMDISSFTANGILHLEFYVDNPAHITGGEFELSSAGTADVNEAQFTVMSFRNNLSAGWNTLELPLSTMGTQGGAINWSSVNFCRFFVLLNGQTTIGLGPTWIQMPSP